MSRVFLMGRLGKNPILRETKNGTAVAHFSMATTRKIYTDPSKGKESITDGTVAPLASPDMLEETQWHQVVVWGKQAEACSKYLATGNRVFVEGEIRSRKYKNTQGEQKLAYEVHANVVNFLEPKPKTSIADLN